MGAPKGNQFWKKRSKHGRNRIIKDAKTLADASDEYFEWCVDNPIIEIDFRGKELARVELPHPRVFQKGELARFCHVCEWDVINNLREVNKDFVQVITRIEGIIRDQKYTHAVVGMFNSNIVARDLGLVDKKDVAVDDKRKDVNELFPGTDELTED